MITGIQIAILGGCLIGLGLTLIIARLLPTSVDAKWAMGQLDQKRDTASTSTTAQTVTGLTGQLGVLIQRRAPADRGWTRIPSKDLTVLDRPAHEHLGEKGLLAVIGLMFPPIFAVFTSVIGLGMPLMLPFFGSIALAALLWKAPDIRVRGEAKKARKEFVRALATYIDGVAMERASGTGTTQALESVAEKADSWVFARISEALAHARWSGHAPWDALKDLADDLSVPELADLAEIMRLSREEGATIYTQLRARATSLRNAQLNEDLARANAASEQMSVPVSTLALIFLALLGTPSVLRVAFGG